jgi:hypothetical protein
MIDEVLGLALDYAPYGIGRVAIAVVSLGRWQCEPWQPQIWTAELFSGPFARRVDGQLIVTRRGVRWAGAGVLVCFGLVLAGLVGCIIWLL